MIKEKLRKEICMNLKKVIKIACITCGLFLGMLPTTTNADQLLQQVRHMSLKDKIAQMYFVPSDGNSNDITTAITHYHVGGIILFGKDFRNQTPQQFKDKLKGWQKESSLPLFIGTDQEGGTVSRLSANPQLTNNRQFPAPQALNNNLSSEVAEARKVASILHQLGINWNFAPVADVTNNPQSFIYPRTYGKNYHQTANYIAQVIPAIQGQNVAATLKHFPGYGTAGDTHTGLASSDKTLADLQSQDLLPFIAGIKCHVDAILVSHIIINQIDQKNPSSLSLQIHRILRNQLGFKGVIITDDLGMGAITQFAQSNHVNADVLAVQAGNDMLLSKNYTTGIPAIEQAVQNHQISEKQINQSVIRILKLKRKLGLIK